MSRVSHACSRRLSVLDLCLLAVLVLVPGHSVAAAAPAAAAATIGIEDLPSRPEVHCAGNAVTAAFRSCLRGATAICCTSLDAVYAHRSSPSFGCLCYPEVLFATILRASDYGLDVLRTLKACKTQNSNPQGRSHSAAFATRWYIARPEPTRPDNLADHNNATAGATSGDDAPTAQQGQASMCPYIPVTASSANVMKQMGPTAVLTSSRTRPVWAWANLLQFGEMHQQFSNVPELWQELIGLQALQLLFTVVLCTPPCFLAMHRAMLFSSTYRGLQGQERMVVCQHGVYAAVFGLSLIPQTILACTALFKAWTGDYLMSRQLAAMCGVFMASRVVLYVVEGSVRSVIKVSWLLIVHHQLFFVIIVMAFWTTNTVLVGIGVVLDLFACHEAPLYVALVSYRLRWPDRVTRALLWVACVWYCITRVFQTVVVVYMIAGFATMSSINTRPEFIATVVIFGALSFIQVYTLVIYHAMYRKLRTKKCPNVVPQCQSGTSDVAAASQARHQSDTSSVDTRVDVGLAGRQLNDKACQPVPLK